MTPSASSVVSGVLAGRRWSRGAPGAPCMGRGCWEGPGLRELPAPNRSGKGRRRKASSQLLIAVASALQGSVDFGPEVTSSDRSLKLLLNAEDKVSVWVLAGHFPRGSAPMRLWAPALGREAESLAGRDPRQFRAYPRAHSRHLTSAV